MALGTLPRKVPRLALPLRLEGTALATVEQDSVDDVAQCVYAILSYEIGERLEDPRFGIEDPSFGPEPIDTSAWLAQIGIYEPRATVQTAEEIGTTYSLIKAFVERAAS